MTAQGRLITLEGGEGAGKSTQAKLLAATLSARGIDCTVTREPGGTAGAMAIRELVVQSDGPEWGAIEEALLMYAARRSHVDALIAPALAAGQWVLCDRFSDSTMAYQGYAKGLGREWIERLDALSLGGVKPDLTVLLDLPVDIGLARAAARGGPDRFERLGVAFHQALRDAFLDIAAKEPDRIAVIDASQDIDAVARAIDAVVQMRLGAASQ